jgi:predicted PurR-regulated permease PerM
VLSVAIAYLGAFALLAAVVMVLSPAIASQLSQFAEQLPASLSRLSDLIQRLREGYAGLTIADWLVEFIDNALRSLSAEASGSLSDAAAWLFSVGTQTLGVLTGIVTGLAVGFYLLASLPSVGPAILETMPPGWRRDLREAGQRVEEVVGGFVRGQLIIAISVGVLTWAGMALVGMPYPALIGLVAGLTDVVPYLGPILASLIAALIGLLADPILAVYGVIIIIVVQQIEGAVLQPKIFGDQVGLHPAIVILAVVAATTLFGFAGLLLAIPFVATFKALY